MEFYMSGIDEVLKRVDSKKKAIFRRAKKRLEEGGKNKLEEAAKTPLIVRFSSRWPTR